MRNAPAVQQQQQQQGGGGGGTTTTALGLLDAHYEKFASAIHRRDGELLATAVSVDCVLRDCFNTKKIGGGAPPSENDVKECKRRRSSSSSNRRVPAPFDDVWEKLAMASLELKRNAFEKCYDYHNEAMAFFIKDFKAREEPEDVIWTIKAMKRMTRDSRLCAEKADRNSRKVGKKATRLETCGAQLMQAYRCSSQTSTREKKLAQLKIVNELFKIYFELNALHLCKNLVNAVNLPTFLPFEESFPSSEKVTYHFYVGRLAVFDDDYENNESSIDLFCKKKFFFSFLKIAFDKVGKITVAIAIPVIANGN